MNAATLVKPSPPKTSPKAATSKKGSGRLAVNLPNQVLDELKELADEEHVTVTEIVRRAISAERFLRGHIEAGNQLLVLEKDQTTPSRVVVFR